MHVAVVVGLWLEHHPPVVFHVHADGLIPTVEIGVAHTAGEQTPTQFVPRQARPRQDAWGGGPHASSTPCRYSPLSMSLSSRNGSALGGDEASCRIAL
jgi:hypothetical protein